MGMRTSKERKLSTLPYNNIVFKLQKGPSPTQYETITPRSSKGTIIKKDLHPNASQLSRVPLNKSPGPQHYDINYNFNSSQINFKDKMPVYSGSKFPNTIRKVFDASHQQFSPGPG